MRAPAAAAAGCLKLRPALLLNLLSALRRTRRAVLAQHDAALRAAFRGISEAEDVAPLRVVIRLLGAKGLLVEGLGPSQVGRLPSARKALWSGG